MKIWRYGKRYESVCHICNGFDFPTPVPIMSSAIANSVSGLSSTVSGMWRSHSVLPESDPETSPEAAQQFRKLRSSSSLNSLRMSLRKRLPLKTVQPNNIIIPENPNSEGFQRSRKTSTVTQIKRTAKNTIGNAYQVRSLRVPFQYRWLIWQRITWRHDMQSTTCSRFIELWLCIKDDIHTESETG